MQKNRPMKAIFIYDWTFWGPRRTRGRGSADTHSTLVKGFLLPKWQGLEGGASLLHCCFIVA